MVCGRGMGRSGLQCLILGWQNYRKLRKTLRKTSRNYPKLISALRRSTRAVRWAASQRDGEFEVWSEVLNLPLIHSYIHVQGNRTQPNHSHRTQVNFEDVEIGNQNSKLVCVPFENETNRNNITHALYAGQLNSFTHLRYLLLLHDRGSFGPPGK